MAETRIDKLKDANAVLLAALREVLPFLEKERYGRDDEAYERKILKMKVCKAIDTGAEL